MGATRRKPSGKQPPRKTRNKATNSAAASAEANTGTDGFESLRVAAEKQLEQLGDQIAEALGKRAADGDLNSTKLLISVVEKKERKSKRRKQPGPGVAEQLALEPPWEEPPETNGDSDAGSEGPVR